MALMRLLHIMCMFRVSYALKITFFTVVSIIAYMLMAISIFNQKEQYGFYLCIISCILHGIVHAFGESVLLGFLKFFPSDAVYYFAFGTGISLIFALVFILFIVNLGAIYG